MITRYRSMHYRLAICLVLWYRARVYIYILLRNMITVPVGYWWLTLRATNLKYAALSLMSALRLCLVGKRDIGSLGQMESLWIIAFHSFFSWADKPTLSPFLICDVLVGILKSFFQGRLPHAFSIKFRLTCWVISRASQIYIYIGESAWVG